MNDSIAPRSCRMLLIGLLLGTPFLWGQSNVHFRHLGPTDGLSQNSVFAITQDATGFMWFGTRDGLNQYDGFDFRVFQHQPDVANSLIDNDIRTLYYDTLAQLLWIGSLQGLSSYDPVRELFHSYKSETGAIQSNLIRDILRDSKGRLWVGTSDGLHWYNEQTDRFEVVLTNSAFPGQQQVNALFEDRNGTLWVGTNAGLGRLVQRAEPHFEVDFTFPSHSNLHQLRDHRIVDLLEDLNGGLWLGTHEKGVYYWKRGENEILHFQHDPTDSNSLSHNQVRSIARSPEGTIWVGTFMGLNEFIHVEQGFRQYQKRDLQPESLTHSSIRDLYFDDRGGMWVGTYHGGLNYFHPSLGSFENFARIPGQNSLSNNVVSSFVEDELGNLWIGTEGGGLNYYDRARDHFKAYTAQEPGTNTLSGNNVKTLLLDGDDLWIGTFQEGLNHYNRTTGQFTQYRVAEGGLTSNNVYSLLREGNQLWIGTYGGGLNVLDPATGQVTVYRHQPQNAQSISSNNIRVQLKDKAGRYWIGTNNGLNLLHHSPSGPGFRRYLSGMHVYALQEHTDGRLLVGTFSHGLVLLEPTTGHYQQFTEEDGLPGHTIFGILSFQDTEIWLSTNRGLSRFDLRDTSFTNFNYSNGLRIVEFNFNAYYQTRSGDFLFGGTNGFTRFHPANIQPNRYTPPVVLTDLKVGNRLVQVDSTDSLLPRALNDMKQLCFRYGEANFSIGFAALDYLHPSNNHYAYKLEGIDDDWIEGIGQKEATYTIQRWGTYTFRLKGANSDGRWNPNERQLTITVLPPIWASPRAYVLYGLLLLLSVYGIWRFVGLRHRLQLERMAKQQQEELSELKLRFFTDITHELRTPLTLIIGPLEEYLSRYRAGTVPAPLVSMRRNAKRLLQLVDQVLSFRKLEREHGELDIREADVVACLQEVYTSFTETARLRQIQLQFQSSHYTIPLHFDRDKLEKVLYNLLSNAFKFTPDHGNIQLSIRRQQQSVLIAVSDSGKGVDPDTFEQIFERYYHRDADNTIGTGIGLALSKKLIELHDGKIWLESEAGKGTTFWVELPLEQQATTANETEKGAANTWAIDQPMALATAEEIAATGQIATTKKLPENAPKLLVVEDQAELRAYICRLFQDDYQLLEAADGVEGLKLIKKERPDLVISDVRMPNMDGDQLCKALKSDIQTSHIPVILLTARTSQPGILKGLKHGADDYVTKPFDADELRLRTRNLIHTRREMRERFIRVINLEPAEVTVNSADEDFLRRALEIAEANIGNYQFTAEQFAFELAVSRPLLFTKLKALTNQTPNNFVKAIRLKRAAQLLTAGDLTVAEVAHRVGFRDKRYFSKCFQKQFQQTPSGYRS